LARHLAAGEERATAARLAEAAATARATEARQRELAARRARFWILGLSVLVVVSVTVGFGMLWMQQREAGERRSVAERAASDALARAHELVGRAQQDTTGTIGTWERALAAARESVAVAEAGQVSEETRQSARAFLDATASSVARARVELEQRQNDLETVERLDQIAAGYGDHQSPRRLDNEYSAAFRDHGLDMNQDGDHILQRVRASAIFEDLVAAIENWGTMLVGVPQPVPAYHEKGRRLLDLAAILDQDPLRAQILAADAKGDRERLRAVAEKLDIASVTPRTVKLLAFRLAALGEFQASRDVLRRALRAYPGDFWLNLAMGISLQGDKGLPWLTAARALRPQSAGVIARIARAEESAGRLDEARSLLERAVDLQPRDGRLLDSLSQLCQRMGDREAALSAARRWVEERPREARAHFRLSLCLHWAGLSSLAEASLDQAIALDGTQADWLYLRAARRYGVWDDAAEEAFREVLRVDPAHGGAHHGLGSVLLGQERLHEAVTHLREAERRLGQKAPAPRPTLLVAENLLAVYERFKAICAGDEDPASSDEAIHFAHLAVQVRRFGSATRLFAWAFEEDPTLGSHLGAGHRREAAIVATLAATDPRSREAPASPEDRRSLLSLAGAWLREDARGLTDLHETGRTRPSRLVQRLESWLAAEEVLGPLWDDPDLTEWRPAECRENEAAWSRMRALLATLE
jgi:tetratricopeptide (TPR) repeat protein